MYKLSRFLLLSFTLIGSIIFTPALMVQAQGLSYPAEINKQFTPILIDAGGTSILRVTVFNPNTFPLTDVTWADDLVGVQPGLSIANPASVNNTCGGGVTAAPGTTTLSVSGGSVPAKVGTSPGECYVEINVTSTTPGNLINTIDAGDLHSTGNSGGTPVSITNTTPASATLTVVSVAPPTLTKSFSPSTILVGQTGVLSITINNNDTDTNLTQTSFTDTLPSGLVLATPLPTPTLTNCGGSATLTAVAGGNTITLNNATVTPSQNCVVGVTVTSTTANAYANSIPAGPDGPGSLVTQQGVTNPAPANATLTVQPVGVTKSFSPTSFQAGGTSTLTITIQNPTASDYTGVNLSDTLPTTPNTNLTYVPASSITTCTPGTASNTGTTVTLTGGRVPANSSCRITINVTTPSGTTAAAYTNTILPRDLTIASNPGVTIASPVTANVSVYATGTGITGSKSFNPATITAGQNTRLRINIFAPADTNLTNFSITDPLPAGVTVSNSTAPAVTGCGAGTLVTAGATSISYTGGTVLAGTRCRIDVWVTSNTPGTITNTISALDNISNDQNRHPTSDLTSPLTVNSTENFSIGKTFYPPTVNPDGLSVLTITLQNSYTSPIINVLVTDPLPGSVTDGVVVAPDPNPSTTCVGGSVTAIPGSQTITMAGGTIPAQSNCIITVTVQGKDSNTTPSNRTNTISPSNVSGTLQSTGAPVNPIAQAQATLRTELLSIGVVKGFNPVLVYGGAASTMSVQLVNPTSAVLTGITFTDTMPDGMIIADPANLDKGLCGGTLTGNPGDSSFSFSDGVLAGNTNCTLTLSATMTVNGNLTNTIPAGAVTTFNGVSSPQPAAASLTNLPGASVSKAFSPNPILAGPGNYSLLTITIQNTGSIPLTGLGLTDGLPGTLPAGLAIAPAPAAVNNCGGTLTAVSGTQNIRLLNGSLAGNSSCTIVVSVTGSIPGDYQNTIPAGNLSSTEGATNLQPAVDILTLTGGTTASIGDYVWNDANANGIQDAGETGIPNVTVNLLDAAGTTLATTTTNASGLYSFTNLTPGSYGVEFIPPAGYSFSPQDQGGNDELDSDADTTTGRTITTTLVAGENDLSWDAGMYQLASLGDYVWNDANANGIQDAGETGIPNVTVNLLDATGATVLATTTTNASGLYSFENLTPGSYRVEFAPPAGFSFSPPDQGGNDEVDSDADITTGRTAPITLVGGENDLSWDAGMYQLASLGDYVWNDVNANGIQDAGETGIPNVTVNLLGASGTVLATTTTNASGLYSFENLTPGAYRVEFVPPAGFGFSPPDQGGNDEVDSDANMTSGRTATTTLVGGENDLSWDAGLNQLASLGDYVWNDANANGIQDGTESGIDGVTVNLYTGAGTLVATTTTSGGGSYLFSGLTPGDYYVEFVPPAGFSFSPQDQGGNDGLDSDADVTTGRTITTTLAAGENDLSWDAGLYSQQGGSGFTKIVKNTNQAFTTGISNVAIGEIITYQVSLAIPPGSFPNARLVDTMQRGLAFVGCDSISGDGLTTDPSDRLSVACSTPSVDDAGGGGTPIGVDTDRRVTFDLGTVTNSGTSDGTLVFVYRAVVLDIGSNVDNVPPVTLGNSASFLWGEENSRGPVAATVSVVEPKLSIDKSADNNFISAGTKVTFTITGTHTAHSHTDAFDVVVTDILPAGFDFVSGSLSCSTGAQVTVNCSYNPVTRTITAVWPAFTRNGGDLRVRFSVIGNDLLVPEVSVTNVGSIEWTSLPGPVNTPQSYSPNKYSTERYYDPLDATDVNNYGTNDSLALNALGGGGGDDEGRGGRNGRNARNIGIGGFLIPITGFAPGRVTDLSSLPVVRYDADLGLSLEIPRLKSNMPIVGAPLKKGTWDVNWLTNQAGWLEKTAFPGFPGNSVLTGHVTSSYGVAGPFASLNKLQEGDLIFIHIFGQTQIYKVQTVKKVQPNDISVLAHQEKPWLTLLTCADYDVKTNKYLSRIVVKAELVEVRNGNISGR